MKLVFYLFYIVSFVISGQAIAHDVDPNVSFAVPEGFEVINTIEENGVLTLADVHGNGLDIYIEQDDFEGTVEDTISDYSGQILSQTVASNGDVWLKINVQESEYPADTIIVSKQREFTVVAYLFELGPVQTHGEFEVRVDKLLRSFAQGGNDVSQKVSFIDEFFDNNVPWSSSG